MQIDTVAVRIGTKGQHVNPCNRGMFVGNRNMGYCLSEIASALGVFSIYNNKGIPEIC